MSKISSGEDYSYSKYTNRTSNLVIDNYEFIGLYGNKYPYAKMENLWNLNKDMFVNEDTFAEFLTNFNSVAVMYNNKFIGCIFIDKFNYNHCYINGYSERKTQGHTSKSLKVFCDYLIDKNRYDYILSKTDIKSAIYCLLKAGFHGSDGLYMYHTKKLSK